jgi:NADH:ubiquinone oxidoreductase subunit 4 (subunit M)
MLKCVYWNHLSKYMHYFICKYQYQIFKCMSIKHTNLVTEPILIHVKVTWALSKCYSYISMVIGAIMMFSYWGVCRSFALIVAHGLCSSGLFCLSNISYERFGRQSLLIYKGLINLMHRMAIFCFSLQACNMAAPPSLNFLVRILCVCVKC